MNSYDPLVGDQLLEFMHAYTVSVLRDAQFYQVGGWSAKGDVRRAFVLTPVV